MIDKNRKFGVVGFLVILLTVFLPCLSYADQVPVSDGTTSSSLFVPIAQVAAVGAGVGIVLYATHHHHSDDSPGVTPTPTPNPTPDPTPNPSPVQVVLGVPEFIALVPGWVINVTVTNTSARITANNVQITLPDSLLADVESIDNSNCTSIAPLGSCIIKVILKNYSGAKTDKPLPTLADNTAVIKGTNTEPANIGFDITTGIEVASSIIEDPSVANNITIKNDSDQTVTLDSLSISTDVHNVNASLPDSCKQIKGNTTCVVPVTATSDAFGQGAITVGYKTPTGEQKTATATLTVANTSLYFIEGVVNNEVKVAYPDQTTTPPQTSTTTTIKVSNTGKFNWQPTPGINKLKWLNDESINGVQIKNDTCSSSNLEPETACTFDLVTDTSAKPDANSILQALGANIDPINSNVIVEGGLAFIPDELQQNFHLGYKAVKVENMTDFDATITKITPSNDLTGRVEYCDPSNTDCYDIKNKNPCELNGKLAAGSSCLIWFKAMPANAIEGKQSGMISITADAVWPTMVKSGKVKGKVRSEQTVKLNVDYENDLYASGYFTQADGKNAKYIAKWDGSNWSSVGTGVNSNTWAITTAADGDLYAAGQFTTAGGKKANNIAKWNGNVWSALGSGTNSYIYSLAATSTGDLLVGGQFAQAGGITVNNIAKFNANDGWSALATGVNHIVNWVITTLKDEIYLGLDSSSNFVRWNKSSATWDALGAGISYKTCYLTPYWYIDSTTAFALTPDNAGLYSAGCLTANTGSGNPAANYIAKWDFANSKWLTLGSGTTNGANGLVDALAMAPNGNGLLYVGGMFHQAGGTAANHIAKWDGTATWSPLGTTAKNGVDDAVWAVKTTPNGELYVAGQFTKATDANKTITVNRIAKWDETSSSWNALGVGTNDIVAAMTIAPSIVITGPI